MIEDLFGSKTRVKLLGLFFSNPNRSFYVREITRKIDEQINSVRRELGNLLKIGIITSDTTNNKLYYEVNQKFEYYKPLLAIFGRARTSVSTSGKGTKASVAKKADPDEAAFENLGNVELALFTGQFTRDESSGIDLLVVGSVNQNKLDKLVNELETREAKEIRYTLLTKSDFDYRRQINDHFLTSVMNAKKQIIIDKSELVEV